MQHTEGARAGGQVPHFRIQTLDHRYVAYPEIWQRKNLLLMLVPAEASAAADAYVAALQARMQELTAHDTVCVISAGRVAGVPQPGVLIADKWGEIQFVTGGAIADLPSPDAIVEWLRFVQVQCPECQGETK